MEKDSLEVVFKNLKGGFDIHDLKKGHEDRFLDKLKGNTKSKKTYNSFGWRPLLAIAASVILIITALTTLDYNPETLDLAAVSPELSETQDFFTVTIETELKKLNEERSPLTENIIKDALEQINILESDYQNLKVDLTESGNDQRVIYAMITNFQNRIDILNSVLEQIKLIKKLKSNTNETNDTI